MAVRIHRVYTRTGDQGETGLVGGGRISKTAPRIEAFGSIDELNSFIGLALAEIPAAGIGGGDAAAIDAIRDALLWIQQKLFDVGSCLATPPEKLQPGMPSAGAGDVQRLEKAIDGFTAKLPALSSFVLPGGGKLGAALHLCRTVCRRAERDVLRLHRESPLDPQVLAFLNRLSDYLFVAARGAASALGIAETLWKPSPPEPSARGAKD